MLIEFLSWIFIVGYSIVLTTFLYNFGAYDNTLSVTSLSPAFLHADLINIGYLKACVFNRS